MEVSVIMPVYNGQKYLKEAIESILNQTHRDFEFIIINDGSTDNSEKIIRSYDDKRIRLFNIPNSGLAPALNFGIKQAQTSLIARMDCDDIAKPKRLELQLNFMEKNPEYVLVGTGAHEIDMDGNFIHTRNTVTSWEEIKKIFPKSPFVHPSVVFRKEIFLKAGQYPTFLSRGEDTVLFNRISKYGKMANIAEPLLYYRITDSSLTDRSLENQKFINDLVRKVIDGASLTQEEEERHAYIIKQRGTKNRKYLYHIYIAKKYLWNNPSKSRAYNHLHKALKINPFSIETYKYLIIGLLPAAIIKYLYRRIKR